jgi:hypothetical protein
MDIFHDHLAPDMATSDPLLSSLWDHQDFDFDCLILNPSDLDNVNDEPQIHSEAVTSPSHGLGQLMDLQPDSPVLAHLLQDWGTLDDMMYRKQIEQGLQPSEADNASNADYKTFHPPMFSVPGTTSDSPFQMSLAASCDGLLSSSVPSSLPELQSFEGISIASLDPSCGRVQPSLSRSDSTSSMQSERGRSRIKDKPNLQKPHGRDTSVFREHIFDSDPARSSRRTSVSWGRRGPLDLESRVTMNAVRGVGACWRCKVMRKSVSCTCLIQGFLKPFYTEVKSNSAMQTHHVTHVQRCLEVPTGELWGASVALSATKCLELHFALQD